MENPIGTMMVGLADVGLQIGGGVFFGLLSIAVALVICEMIRKN